MGGQCRGRVGSGDVDDDDDYDDDYDDGGERARGERGVAMSGCGGTTAWLRAREKILIFPPDTSTESF